MNGCHTPSSTLEVGLDTGPLVGWGTTGRHLRQGLLTTEAVLRQVITVTLTHHFKVVVIRPYFLHLVHSLEWTVKEVGGEERYRLEE